MDEELFFRDEQGKCLLEKESTPHEDAEKTIEMSTKDLDCDINKVERAAAGSQKRRCDGRCRCWGHVVVSR